MVDCVFCKIVKGELPATVVSETNDVIAIQNIKPVAKHHVLIIPKAHIAKFTDINLEHKEIVMQMVEVAQKLIAEKKTESGYKLIFNGGKYQAIPHLHWHLLGGELEDDNT